MRRVSTRNFNFNFIVHSFNSDLKTYADAQEFCETEAMNGFRTGRLFEPVRQSQNDMVYAESIRQFGGLQNTWIGVQLEKDFWHYTSSGATLFWENWRTGQPDNGAHFKCVHLFNGLWYNYDCNYKAFFICQFVKWTYDDFFPV